ncbi:hypothetical protein BDE02_01G337400 [Populus trichocarpa]|nr:hypothetical protein BDE02_01G337400 [Populus trichocarpa]
MSKASRHSLYGGEVPKLSCCSASSLRSRSGISRWNPSPQSSVMAPVRIYRGLPCC